MVAAILNHMNPRVHRYYYPRHCRAVFTDVLIQMRLGGWQALSRVAVGPAIELELLCAPSFPPRKKGRGSWFAGAGIVLPFAQEKIPVWLASIPCVDVVREY
jgi:hypothetical protein